MSNEFGHPRSQFEPGYVPPNADDIEDDAVDWEEAEADEAIAKGEVLGPFNNAKDAIKALKKAKL